MKKAIQVSLIVLGIIILVFLLNPPYRMIHVGDGCAYLYNAYTGQTWAVSQGTKRPVLKEDWPQPDLEKSDQ